MKKALLVLLVLFLAPALAAQFSLLNPRPTPNAVYAGYAPAPNHFVGVTDQGEAVVTFDGGNNWMVNPIGGDGIYRGVFFTDDMHGWAVGSFVERLHKTTDGGVTWVHLPNAPDTTKYGVFFTDNNTGWTVGFNGMIAKTTNGGDLWFSQSNTSITTKTLYGVWALNSNTVFIVGNDNALLKSTDGGSTWTLLPAIFPSVTDYRRIYFINSSTGYLVGERSSIAKTTDGGDTWSIVNGPTGTAVLWDVEFNSTGTIGVASGGSSKVYRTTNSGANWTEMPVISSTSVTFYSAQFGDDNTVYLAGSRGYLLKSTDAGASFSISGYRFGEFSIEDVSFANNDVGYIVGTNLIAKSTNGGTTFEQLTPPITGDISEVSAPSADTVYAACDDGIVLRTTNGGAAWDVLNTNLGTSIEFLGIDFLTPSFGYVAGSNGKVLKTTDAGATWIDVSISTTSLLWDMDFVDQNSGWVVGTGEKIFGTKDGGVTWTEQYSGGGLGTYGVSFIDAMRGIASGTGGNTYYTDDGGANWNPAITPPGNTSWGVHYVETVNGTLALTASASGRVYRSEDGGRSWIEEPRYSISTYSDITFTDAANAWIVGSSGLILKYTNPANIPVELFSFNAVVENNNVTLQWTTATEMNNMGFEIERLGEDGIGWEKIGFAEGRGTSSDPSAYAYSDNHLAPGRYGYRLKQIDFNGTYKYYELEQDVDISAPLNFLLEQNYPNPFNPVTTIRYTLGTPGLVQIKVFDILGNQVATLVNGMMEAGIHAVNFDASGIASGVYYYKITAGAFSDTKKMVLAK